MPADHSKPLPPYQSPLEDHPEHVRAIGMISIEMANMDYLLGGLLGALLHIDEKIARTIYLTPRVAIGRIEILENVIALSVMPATEMHKRVEAVAKKGKSLIQKRHRMIHDFWGVDIETGLPSRMPIPSPSDGKKLVPLNELADMIRNIRELATAAKELTGALYASWPPYSSLDKSGLPFQERDVAPKHPRKENPRRPRRQP